MLLTLERTQHAFASWDIVKRHLRSGDTVTVVGDLQGPFSVECSDVTVRGTSTAQRFTVLAPEGQKTSVTLGADGVVIRFANVHAAKASTKFWPSTVLVRKGVRGCRLEQCDIFGTGAPFTIKSSAWQGVRFGWQRCTD